MSITLSNVIILVSITLMIAFLYYDFLYSQERGIRYFAGVMDGGTQNNSRLRIRKA
jgi:hypothetical protein